MDLRRLERGADEFIIDEYEILEESVLLLKCGILRRPPLEFLIVEHEKAEAFGKILVLVRECISAYEVRKLRILLLHIVGHPAYGVEILRRIVIPVILKVSDIDHMPQFMHEHLHCLFDVLHVSGEDELGSRILPSRILPGLIDDDLQRGDLIEERFRVRIEFQRLQKEAVHDDILGLELDGERG